jgi:hypothetical protein
MTMDEGSVTLPDVNKESWSYEALAIGKNTGLLTGYQDGTVHGDASVNRGEAMVMVGRLVRLV